MPQKNLGYHYGIVCLHHFVCKLIIVLLKVGVLRDGKLGGVAVLFWGPNQSLATSADHSRFSGTLFLGCGSRDIYQEVPLYLPPTVHLHDCVGLVSIVVVEVGQNRGHHRPVSAPRSPHSTNHDSYHPFGPPSI